MTTSINGVPAGPFIIYTGSFTIDSTALWDANSIRYTVGANQYTYISAQYEPDNISSSRFTSPPTVFANITTGAGGTSPLIAKVINIYNDYANISVANCSPNTVSPGVAVTVNWMAIGT